MDTLLLFDIDGTLLNTGGAGQRAMQRAAQELFAGKLSFEGVSFAGRLDPLIFAAAAERCALPDAYAHHDRFHDAYLPELERELVEQAHGVSACPGIHALLDTLRTPQADAQRRGHAFVLGLLTGNYTAAAPLKLRAVGLDPDRFTLTAFGDEAPTRPDLVALALRKFREAHGRDLPPRRAAVIGDTIHDVGCAKQHDCVCFAVTTGRATADELAAAGADAVLPDLTDPAPLLDWIATDRLPG